MKKRRIVFIAVMLFFILTFIFVNVYAADENELIPNGTKYFGKPNSDAGLLLTGVLGLFAIVVAAIGIIGLVRTIIYVAQMGFKMLSGKEKGSQTWKVAGIAFIVFALLSTGGWYGLMTTVNKVGLSRAVNTFNKDTTPGQDSSTAKTNANMPTEKKE